MSKVSEMLAGLVEAAAGKVSLHLREGADVSGYSVASCAPGHRECHCLFLETVAFVHQLPHPAPEGADKQSQSWPYCSFVKHPYSFSCWHFYHLVTLIKIIKQAMKMTQKKRDSYEIVSHCGRMSSFFCPVLNWNSHICIYICVYAHTHPCA